jgi:hypothetical protein
LEWQAQGERILVCIDMNKHVLTGTLAQEFFRLGMVEATHMQWHGEEPHTYIDGSAPVDGVYHSPNLEVMAIAQLSFHEGVGYHRTVLVDVTTRLAIGQQEFRVVRLLAWKLSTKNKASTKTYLKRMVTEFERHKLVDCQHSIIAELGKGPITAHIQEAIEMLDVKKTEIQHSCESQCRKIVKPFLPFSIPVQTAHKQQEAFVNLKQRHNGKSRNSNIIWDTVKVGITNPRDLTVEKCAAGIAASKRQLLDLEAKADRSAMTRAPGQQVQVCVHPGQPSMLQGDRRDYQAQGAEGQLVAHQAGNG